MFARKKAARLLSRREVMDRIGVSYTTLWSWMRLGKFPRSREIGGKIAWIEAEVDRWIANLPVVKLKGDEAAR
jgi:predicted DNA-binding transcriptional regulator AlpA